MPKFTPATKVTRTAAWGAKVVLHGETLAEAAAHAQHLAAERSSWCSCIPTTMPA